MNQKQREYLIGAIEKQFSREKKKLDDKAPKEPSLNNYLVAAVLDGTFKLKSADELRASIRETVLNLGKDDAFVGKERQTWHSGAAREAVVTLPAATLFDYPDNYRAAREKYEKELAAWQEETEKLEAALNAMKIKVQLGSDGALSQLINQADQLCTMSLTASSKLMLTQ